MVIDLRIVKNELRTVMKARRAKAQADNPHAAIQLRDQFLNHIELAPGAVIAGTVMYGTEIDLTPLLDALRAKGHVIALPVVTGRNQVMMFRRYEVGDPLQKSEVGVGEPLPGAQIVVPDVLIVPLLAFDSRCHRLGYGGGYYDRTIKQIRLHKPLMVLGFGYDCQMVPEVPCGKHDVQLDKIITEAQLFSS